MRPIERGAKPRNYSKYNQAISDLERRIGIYCTFCESRVPIGLAVEHKLPKEHFPSLELEWDNFLLACMTCNSIKGKKVLKKCETLWPDTNNTKLALVYTEGGFVSSSIHLGGGLKKRARSLIDLVGLDRHGATDRSRLSPRDKRWSEREKIWTLAKYYKARFENSENPDRVMDTVVDLAMGFGFFSVWYEVFKDESKVLNALITAFPGTARNCFDKNGISVSRPGARI